LLLIYTRISDVKKGVKKLNKAQKTQVISELQDKFGKAKGVVFTDYRGLNVEEITNLRNILRSDSLEYRVVKNTLAIRASVGTPVEAAKDSFTGPVGIAVGYDDPVLLIKKVLEFNKTNEKLEITGGVVEGSICSVDQIKTISKLPSREVQLSMLVGAMQAPASKMASLLNSTLTQFIYAFEALKNTKTE
jgi:large subunit ribosomal protein L10